MFKTGSRVVLLGRSYLGTGSVIKQEAGAVEVLWDNEKVSKTYDQSKLSFWKEFSRTKILDYTIEKKPDENNPEG